MPDPADSQPAGLALQVALTELWRSRGVVPGAVVGHSFGEVAGAWAAGALTLEQAFELASHRSRLEQTLCGRGGMVAVACGEHDLALAPGVSVAAVNGPRSVTLTGDIEAIAAVDGTRLNVSIAYHSAQAEALRDTFAAAAGHIRARAPRLPLYSTVAGAHVTDADYWWRNLREPTRFDVALSRLARDGYSAFVELGPHPALAALVLDAVPGAVVTASMRRRRPQAPFFAAAEAKLLGTARREPVALADVL